MLFDLGQGYKPNYFIKSLRYARGTRSVKISISALTQFEAMGSKKKDLTYLFFLILIIVGLPFGIRAYDRYLQPKASAPGTKEFTLTGHAQKGWVLGAVKANDIISLWQEKGPAEKPLIEVSKGDQVIIKLRSADMTHGFSLKAFGIYIAKGIQPGKTVYVSFKADKVGTFNFMCTVFCGDIHRHMEGTLVVRDEPLQAET
jgi:heme/copper-type cytochrome/quinol oxidase subunit 2